MPRSLTGRGVERTEGDPSDEHRYQAKDGWAHDAPSVAHVPSLRGVVLGAQVSARLAPKLAPLGTANLTAYPILVGRSNLPKPILVGKIFASPVAIIA